jgi:hypothetical protein
MQAEVIVFTTLPIKYASSVVTFKGGFTEEIPVALFQTAVSGNCIAALNDFTLRTVFILSNVLFNKVSNPGKLDCAFTLKTRSWKTHAAIRNLSLSFDIVCCFGISKLKEKGRIPSYHSPI